MVAMLLSLAEQSESIHVSHVVEASLQKCSGTLNRFRYSGCVFTVVFFTENGVFLANSSRKILNPLRHYRLTHLVEEYGFDAYDLTVYAGWTFKTIFKGSAGQLDTYLHLDWRKYYEKLLKPINLA